MGVCHSVRRRRWKHWNGNPPEPDFSLCVCVRVCVCVCVVCVFVCVCVCVVLWLYAVPSLVLRLDPVPQSPGNAGTNFLARRGGGHRLGTRSRSRLLLCCGRGLYPVAVSLTGPLYAYVRPSTPTCVASGPCSLSPGGKKVCSNMQSLIVGVSAFLC